MVKLQEEVTDTSVLTGHAEITGAMLSFNVMVNEHELEFPAASVAVRVINCEVLCPVSIVPATGVCESVALQLSEIVAK